MKVDLALDTLAFRKTMGLFATGVAVLATVADDGQTIGMTANAITSVSLDPMLILVCVAKNAHIAPYILATPGFSLNFLDAHQEDLSVFFAGKWKEPILPAFEFLAWEGSAPLLNGCMAAAACRRTQVIEGGDHWIVLGEVTALYRAEDTSDPLLFYGGKYHRLRKTAQTDRI